jgi:AcrR family transcriptional regulator
LGEEQGRRRSRLPTDERREQLLALGLRVFVERTYDEISIDEIAREAGISKGLLYHYFPSKRAFYIAALREALRQLIQETRPPEGAQPNLEDMRRGIDAYLGYVERHARAYVFLMKGGLGLDPEVQEIIEEAREEHLGRLLTSLGDPSEPRLRIGMRGFLGFVEAASLDWLERGGVDRAAMCDLIMEGFLGLVAPWVAPPSP